jgi:hypothetical protein
VYEDPIDSEGVLVLDWIGVLLGGWVRVNCGVGEVVPGWLYDRTADGLADPDILAMTVAVSRAVDEMLKLTEGVNDGFGLADADRTEAGEDVPVWQADPDDDSDSELVTDANGEYEREAVYVFILLTVLEIVDKTEAVLDTLEHAVVDLDLVGEADTVTDLLADLVFRGDALTDLWAVLLREIRDDTEGVVVWDWETDFLDVADVQIVDVVLWDGEAVFVVELETELLSEAE